MKKSFGKFAEGKEEELGRMGSTVIDFDGQTRMFGTKTASFRQPPLFYAYLEMLMKYIPLTSKAEIVFEAIQSAYFEISDSVPEDRQDTLNVELNELLQHHIALIVPDDSNIEKGHSGLSVSADEKAAAVALEKSKEDQGEMKL
jgi:hypothetical protein